MFKPIIRIAPGVLLALAVAISASVIEWLSPIHSIRASVMALFAGMLISTLIRPGGTVKPGLTFTSKKVLKCAIVLIGASLSVQHILLIGRMTLIVLFFTLTTCFCGSYFLGKLLKINWKLSGLIATGTGICGGSAIAAVAPAIEADNTDIAYAVSATFLFDLAMIIVFPFIGLRLGLNDLLYGLWTGTSINDTSSVVAAGYAFSESSGDFATMVKLTRTLFIIPTVLVFAYIHIKNSLKTAQKRGNHVLQRVKIKSLVPWFIAGFITLALLNSIGLIPLAISVPIKSFGRFLMVCALAAIGLNTNLKELRQSGIRPMIHAVILSSAVALAALVAAYYASGV